MRTRTLTCVTAMAAALLAAPASAVAAPDAGCSARNGAWVHLYTQENFQNEGGSAFVCPDTPHYDLKNSNTHDHVRSWMADGPAPQNGGMHVTVCLLDYVGSQRIVLGRVTTGGEFNSAGQSSLGNNKDRADAVELC